jgi:hypothetical protein
MGTTNFYRNICLIGRKGRNGLKTFSFREDGLTDKKKSASDDSADHGVGGKNLIIKRKAEL